MAHLLKQIITKNKQTNKIIGAAATATPFTDIFANNKYFSTPIIRIKNNYYSRKYFSNNNNNANNNIFVPIIPYLNSNDHLNKHKTITNIVPSNIIPPTTNKVNFQWGKQTFKYEQIFLDNIKSKAYENMEEVHSWLMKVNRIIQEELNNFGYSELVKHICDLLRQKGQRLPNSSNFATNFNDILQLFGNF